MAKFLMNFLVILIVSQGMGMLLLCNAAPTSDTFQEWLLTFDPSKTPASRSGICTSKPDDFYPANSPDTCTRNYYACVDGAQYPQICFSPNMVWDTTQGKCTDHPKSEACKQIMPPSCDSLQDGEMKPTGLCAPLYYLCVNGDLVFKKCDTDKVFDSESKTCQVKTGINACKKPPAVPPFTCLDKTVNNFYALGTCTSNYYTCETTTAEPTIASCSNNKIFDYSQDPVTDASSACILKTVAEGCKSTTTVKPATTTTMKKPFICPAPSGVYPIPGATCCVNYYRCSASVASKVNCASGSYFDKSACVAKTSTCPSPTTCTY